jgi:Trypsin-like peptidase domain/Zinc finger, ZZ type
MSSGGAELIHIWNRCHACGAAPIVGLRFTCQTCPTGADNDLCQACYGLFEQGQIEHPAPEAREAPAGRHVFRAFEGIERAQVVPWLSVPWSVATAPRVPDRAVVRPEFRSGRESFFGSYAFVAVAEDGRPPLVLTALHVLDELAKFRGINCSDNNSGYSGRELPDQITNVRLYDPFAPNWMLAELGTAGDMLVLPQARICSIEPYSEGDIAAFRVVPPSSFRPLRLATVLPAVGDPIWLAVNPGRGARERTVQAVMVEITDETFVFRFAKPVTFPPHTSGAPLLNRAGEVVAINVGGGTLDEHKLGHGAHVASVRRHLGWR